VTPKQEQELLINDLFLIVKAVKEHLKEADCTHNIRSIVKQALESKTYYLGRLSVVEEKVDKILNEGNKPKPYIERGYRA
jgi:hypothetical protein